MSGAVYSVRQRSLYVLGSHLSHTRNPRGPGSVSEVAGAPRLFHLFLWPFFTSFGNSLSTLMALTIQHRSLQPAGPSGPPPGSNQQQQQQQQHVQARLTEHFEAIRQEVEHLGADSNSLRMQRDEHEKTSCVSSLISTSSLQLLIDCCSTQYRLKLTN